MLYSSWCYGVKQYELPFRQLQALCTVKLISRKSSCQILNFSSRGLES